MHKQTDRQVTDRQTGQKDILKDRWTDRQTERRKERLDRQSIHAPNSVKGV